MNVDGFNYESWYNMPIHLRTYYVDVIGQKTEERIKEMKRTTKVPNLPTMRTK